MIQDRKSNVSESKATGGFSRCVVLAAGIFLSCSAKPIAVPPKPVSIHAKPEVPGSVATIERVIVGHECSTPSGRYVAGQEYHVGLSRMPIYSVKIARMEGERIFADVTLPHVPPAFALNFTYFRTKFNGVEMSRQQLIDFADTSCGIVSALRREIDDYGIGEDGDSPDYQPARAGRAAGGPDIIDSGSTLLEGMLRDRMAGRALASLRAMMGGRQPRDDETAQFTVSGSDRREFVLRSPDGKAFRLDRRMTIAVEHFVEDGVYFRLPYIVRALDNPRVSIDCSRGIRYESAYSERSFPHPNCP